MTAIARTPMLEATIATLQSSLRTLDGLGSTLSRTQIAELGVINVDVAQSTAVLTIAPGLEPVAAAAVQAREAIDTLARSAVVADADPSKSIAIARHHLSRTVAAAESAIAASQHAGRADDVASLLRAARTSSSISPEHGDLLATRRASEILGEVATRALSTLENGANPHATYDALGEFEHVALGIVAGLDDAAAPFSGQSLTAASTAARDGHAYLRQLAETPDAAIAGKLLVPEGKNTAERATSMRRDMTSKAITTAVDRLQLDLARHQALADARTRFSALVD